MNDTLIVILSIAAAIAAGMLFTSWRIKRLQYPPELRWPSERKARRQRGKKAPEKTD